MKVITKSDEKQKLLRISFEEGEFYGVKKKNGTILRIPLYAESVNKVKLKNRTVSTLLTFGIPLLIIVPAVISYEESALSGVWTYNKN